MKEKLLLIRVFKELSKIRSLTKFLEENPTLKSVDIRRKSLEVFVGDYREHAMKHVKSGEVRDKALELCTRSCIELEAAIERYHSKIAEVESAELRQIELTQTALYLHSVLNKFLQENPAFFTTRELDCLCALIDDGTIDTEESLSEYI